MREKWICSASVNLWPQIIGIAFYQHGFLLIAVLILTTHCVKQCCRFRTSKEVTAISKSPKDMTTKNGTPTANGVSDGGTSSNEMIKKSDGVVRSPKDSADGEAKPVEDGLDEKVRKKVTKSKKKRGEPDEKNNSKDGGDVTKKEPNHENTLRIEMVDDDHTKTHTEASACFDVCDSNNQNKGNKGSRQMSSRKIEKQESYNALSALAMSALTGKRNNDKGGMKKKKDVLVQSVECAEAKAKGDISEEKSNIKTVEDGKAQQKSGPGEKKVTSVIENEQPKQRERKSRELLDPEKKEKGKDLSLYLQR